MNQLISFLAGESAPQHILAGLEILQFRNASADRLAHLTEAERGRFLNWADSRQLTLLVPHLCGSELPAWVAKEVLEKAARYDQRFKRLKREILEIVDALHEAGLKFVMLKGLSHAPALTPEARMRAQGDIDLWFMGASVHRARDVLTRLGYVPLLESNSRHLAPMGRPSAWVWHGDLFDPEMPISVELHYELWSEQAEYISVPGLDQFWERKELRDFDGRKIHVLCDQDLLGFATLHLLLHLLHGELPLQRAWEIARFLDTHAEDQSFWTLWQNSHPLALTQLETSVFYLVTRWFDCSSTEQRAADIRELPVMVKSWLDLFYWAPLKREWAPNKLEIGLHLALIRVRGDKARVLVRRLLPTSLPFFVDRAEMTASPIANLAKLLRQFRPVSARFIRHLLTLFPALFYGLRWLLSPNR